MSKFNNSAFKKITWLAGILAVLLLSLLMVKFHDIIWLTKTISGLNTFQAMHLQEAESQLKDALEIAEHFEEGDDRIVMSLLALGDLYMAQGKYDKAYPLIERSLQISEKKYGVDSLGTVSSLNNLAGFYRRQGQYPKAEALYRRVLKIMETNQANPLKIAEQLQTMGSLLNFLGRTADAKACFERALIIKKNVLPATSLSIAETFSSLGDIAEAEGHYKTAESLYLKSMDMYSKVRAKDHADVARSLIPITKLYLSLSDFDRAAPLADRALKGLENKGGNDYLRTAIVAALMNQAKVLIHQGNYKEANSLLAQAEWVAKERLSSKHPGVAQVLDVQARIALEQGDLEKAEKLLKHALKVMEMAVGPNHRWVALLTMHLAEVEAKRGDRAEAQQLFQSALDTSAKTIGKAHPEFGTILESYAQFASSSDQSRAQALKAEADSIRSKALSL